MEIQEVKDLTPISWANQPVLVSKQVAKAYNTTVNCLNKNFTRAKEYFTEGVHYYKLTGDALRQFKEKYPTFADQYSTWIYLWTIRGILLHGKMINTDAGIYIERDLQLKILRYQHTDFAPADFMFKLEKMCLEKFENRRAYRQEYFNITFEEACAELDSHKDEISA